MASRSDSFRMNPITLFALIGGVVAFVSQAANFSLVSTSHTGQLFVRDLESGTDTLPDGVTFDAATFMRTGGARLYGFILFHELPHRPAAQGLARLVAMVAEGRLNPQIELEAPFNQIAEVANKLYARGVGGKAVLIL